MKTRFLAIGLAAIASALVACGGGGGGGGGTPPTPVPTSTPTIAPTATPTNNPYGCVGQTPFVVAAASRRAMLAPRPIASGDKFAYSGSLSQTYTQSAPCPQPTATTTAQISSTVTDTATTAPGGGSASTATTVETDAFPTSTTTTTTAQVLQISGGKLLLYSTKSSDSINNSITTSYGSNAQEIDDLGTGGTWSNGPASTVSESLSDGTAISRNVASDGSYTDTETFADGSTATIAVNGLANSKPLDGSGVYSFAGASFSYAAPAAGTITLTITSSGNPTKTRTFPAWFTVPANYISDSFSDNGTKPFDATCSVNPSLGLSSGTQIVETYSVLDPILGYTETRTTTTYDVAGFGPACVVISDVLDGYYDYALNTTKIDYQSQNGQPNSVNAINETLSVQSGTCGAGGSAPCAQLRRADAQPVSPVAVAGRIAAIDHYRAIERAQRAEALRRFAMQFVHQGALR